jgi:hypothetical protein
MLATRTVPADRATSEASTGRCSVRALVASMAPVPAMAGTMEVQIG